MLHLSAPLLSDPSCVGREQRLVGPSRDLLDPLVLVDPVDQKTDRSCRKQTLERNCRSMLKPIAKKLEHHHRRKKIVGMNRMMGDFRSQSVLHVFRRDLPVHVLDIHRRHLLHDNYPSVDGRKDRMLLS